LLTDELYDSSSSEIILRPDVLRIIEKFPFHKYWA
jgi:hypothetical protein